jgi:ABC-type Fe3+-hydroxamate transport system substrate-binding protein
VFRLSKSLFSRCAVLRRESIWLAPLVCLGLISFSLLRPYPVIFSSFQGNTITITDAVGDKVQVPSPPQGVMSAYLRSYLPKTHAPEQLLRLGGARERRWFADTIPAWIFPELLDDHYWNGAPQNLESILGEDRPGTLYFGSLWIGGAKFESAELHELGLMAVATSPPPVSPTLLEQQGMLEQEYHMFADIRAMNAALGQQEHGEKLIAAYLEGLAQLKDELQPDAVPEAEWPRVLGMGALSNDGSRIFVSEGGNPRLASPRLASRDSIEGRKAMGRLQDAERILTINPDIILLFVGEAGEFYRDPRWRGLKAVRDRRVYTNNPNFHGYSHDIDNIPMSSRWLAEIYHPGRLVPQTRRRIREHYQQSYGYDMDDEHIDKLLQITANAVSTGYDRFRAQAVTEAAIQEPTAAENASKATP